MNPDKAKTVAFTGHRRNRITISESELQERLKIYIGLSIANGYDTFLSGMAEGFDLAAARAVLEMKKICPQIRLIAVIPFPGQDGYFSPEVKQEYSRIKAAADEVVILSDHYYKDCFLRRNDYLLGNSSRMICYFDGAPRGGTYYTVKRAGQVINLASI